MGRFSSYSYRKASLSSQINPVLCVWLQSPVRSCAFETFPHLSFDSWEKVKNLYNVFFLPKISNLSETLRLSLISSHFSSPSSTFKAFHCMLSSQVGRLQRHEGRVSYFIYDQFPQFTENFGSSKGDGCQCWGWIIQAR